MAPANNNTMTEGAEDKQFDWNATSACDSALDTMALEDEKKEEVSKIRQGGRGSQQGTVQTPGVLNPHDNTQKEVPEIDDEAPPVNDAMLPIVPQVTPPPELEEGREHVPEAVPLGMEEEHKKLRERHWILCGQALDKTVVLWIGNLVLSFTALVLTVAALLTCHYVIIDFSVHYFARVEEYDWDTGHANGNYTQEEANCPRDFGLFRTCTKSYNGFYGCGEYFRGAISHSELLSGVRFVGAVAGVIGLIAIIVDCARPWKNVQSLDSRRSIFLALFLAKVTCAVFLGLTLLTLDSGICAEECIEAELSSYDPSEAEVCGTKCTPGVGPSLSISACAFWAASAVATAVMALASRAS